MLESSRGLAGRVLTRPGRHKRVGIHQARERTTLGANEGTHLHKILLGANQLLLKLGYVSFILDELV